MLSNIQIFKTKFYLISKKNTYFSKNLYCKREIIRSIGGWSLKNSRMNLFNISHILFNLILNIPLMPHRLVTVLGQKKTQTLLLTCVWITHKWFHCKIPFARCIFFKFVFLFIFDEQKKKFSITDWESISAGRKKLFRNYNR